MNKSELIEAIAQEADISKAAAAKALDGLTNAVPRPQLEQLLRTGSFYDLPDLLIRAANENGGKDNITALLLGVEPLEVHHG